MKILRHRYFHAVALLLFASLALSATAIETRPIEFAKGTSSATLKGSLKGSQTIDYTVRAKSGQTMSVALATSNSSNYFNVLPPGSNDVAVFIGSSGGNQLVGEIVHRSDVFADLTVGVDVELHDLRWQKSTQNKLVNHARGGGDEDG